MVRCPRYSKEVKIKACKDSEEGHNSFKGMAYEYHAETNHTAMCLSY